MELTLERRSITISEKKEYSIQYNREENRFYLKINGFWRSPEVVPDYISDWNKALKLSKKDFTLLTDVTDMSIHPQSVRDLHKQAQDLLVRHGVRKVAELQKNKVAEMQLDGVSKDSKMPKQNFNDIESAKKYLSI